MNKFMRLQGINTAIIGSGNIGTQLAVEFASHKYCVSVYSTKPDMFSNILYITDNCGNVIKEANIHCVTNDLLFSVKDADLIIVTQPAFMLKDTAGAILGHVKPGVIIGLIPGTGGGEFVFKRHIDNGATLFGLQRVPDVARLNEYGHSVCVSGKREKLYLGTIPPCAAPDMAEFIGGIFDMPCECLPNYLCITLTPANPILHTTRLRALFADYKNGITYQNVLLFYEEWNDETSRLLFACDDELHKICHVLSKMDLTSVKSLRIHYESNTPEALTQKIKSIKSLQGLTSPVVKTGGGYIPDFSSRYFTADFPYGLSIIMQVADLAGVNVSNIFETIKWYE